MRASVFGGILRGERGTVLREGNGLFFGEKSGLFLGREWAVLWESAGIFGENLWFILGVSFYIGLGNRGI